MAHEKEKAGRVADLVPSVGEGVRSIHDIVDGCSDVQQAVQAPPPVVVPLSPGATETMRALFFHGPTWDGDVPSKAGRDELVNLGLAHRGRGWQWLTGQGVQVAMDNCLHKQKELYVARRENRISRIEELARQITAA